MVLEGLTGGSQLAESVQKVFFDFWVAWMAVCRSFSLILVASWFGELFGIAVFTGSFLEMFMRSCRG